MERTGLGWVLKKMRISQKSGMNVCGPTGAWALGSEGFQHLPGVEYFLLAKEPLTVLPKPCKPLAIAAALGFPPELNSKPWLLKTTRTLDTEHRRTELELNWKHHLLNSIHRAGRCHLSCWWRKVSSDLTQLWTRQARYVHWCKSGYPTTFWSDLRLTAREEVHASYYNPAQKPIA